MEKDKLSISETWKVSKYGIGLIFSLAKWRVVCSVVKQIIRYLLWVFYSAYFIRFVIQTIQNERPLKEILLNIAVIGGVSLILQAYQYLCDNIIFPLHDVKLFQGVYKKIYVKSENVELECYEKSNFYNKFSIALDGIGSKLGEFTDNISEIIGGFIGGIIACWAMVEIDPVTILFLIAPLIGNFVFAPKLNAIYYNRYIDSIPYDRKMGYVNRVMYLAKYAKELRLSNIFNVINRMFDSAVEEKASIWKKYFNRAFLLGMLQYIFSYIIIFEGILLYGTYRAISSQSNPITFDQMAVLTSVMVTASWVWVRVINAINRNTQTCLVISDLKDFLEYEAKMPENSEGIIPSKNVKSIEFRNVSFSYNGKKNVINNLSFKVCQGENLALVGHNGAGKTTIIKLLLRLYDPTEGTILVNDIDIRNYNLQEYRKLFSCAFQDYAIFAGTIRENILMGRNGTDEDVEEALKEAGIYEKVMGFPKGIYTMLTKEFDDEGVLLSGGEFQKIVCARVFVENRMVSVFDEPSSALDPISENELFNNIIKSVKDRIGIFISHRLSSVKAADSVLMLDNGGIIEIGSHEKLMQMNRAYAKMYKTQEKNYYTFDEDEIVSENE